MSVCPVREIFLTLGVGLNNMCVLSSLIRKRVCGVGTGGAGRFVWAA